MRFQLLSNSFVARLAGLVLATIALQSGKHVPAQEPVVHDLTPDLEYQATCTDRKTFEIDFSAVVTPSYGTRVLRVWMPVPPSDKVQQVADSRFSTFPVEVQPQFNTESVYGNRFACFDFHKPLGAQVIRHRFKATVANLNWNVDSNQIDRPEQWPGAFDLWLKSSSITDSADFRKVLQEFTVDNRTDAGSFYRAMNWIDGQMTYDHKNASLQADAAHAFSTRQGHCSDYHGLCGAFGRELGFPTRVTYGLSLYPKNSPSHCKLEAYLPPYGWVSFDISETQKFVAKIHANMSLNETEKKKLTAAAIARLLAGFRENSWLLCTTGTNDELAPRASRPVAVVRTIYAEADGVALPEPDPANIDQREFGWMTVHHYRTKGEVMKPYEDLATLQSR